MNREWIKSVEQQLRELRQRTRGIVARPRAGGGGAGTSVQVDYTAASKTLLEDYTGVVDYARGRVTDGADKGVVYVRNPDNDGWDALNRLE